MADGAVEPTESGFVDDFSPGNTLHSLAPLIWILNYTFIYYSIEAMKVALINWII